jgi:hypothetical protein
VEGTAQGLVTMLLGVILLGIAVVLARDTGEGSRPLFGPLRSPFGSPPAPPAATVPPPPPTEPAAEGSAPDAPPASPLD